MANEKRTIGITQEEFVAAPVAPPAHVPHEPPTGVVRPTTRFRVLEDKKFRIGVAQAKFCAGQIVNPTLYFPNVWAEMRAQLKLEPVKG